MGTLGQILQDAVTKNRNSHLDNNTDGGIYLIPQYEGEADDIIESVKEKIKQAENKE